MSKIIILGQAPAATYGEEEPLAGAARDALLRYAGRVNRHDLWQQLVEPMNLLDYYPGKQGKGDRFPVAEAEAAAWNMIEELHGRTVVMLGKNVMKAFGLKLDWFQWKTVTSCGCTFEVAVCPHPSGVNRWWNSSTNKEKAKRFLDRLFTQGAVLCSK